MDHKISKGYGNVYLADTIIYMLNKLQPNRESDSHKISKMINDLNDLMIFECLEADKRVESIQHKKNIDINTIDKYNIPVDWIESFKKYMSLTGLEPMHLDEVSNGSMQAYEAWRSNIKWFDGLNNEVQNIRSTEYEDY